MRRPKDEVLAEWNEPMWRATVIEMKLRVADGLVDQACLALRRYAYREMPELATLDCSPSEVFPIRLAKSLEEEGYCNLRSIHLESDSNLLAIRNFGRHSLQEVRETLQAVLAGKRFSDSDMPGKETTE